MTLALGRDPSRRCLRLSEWPPRDRALWEAALQPGDAFDEGGSRAMHSEASNRWVASGYGRWLAWLLWRGQLDLDASPGDRITRASVRAYLADLMEWNASSTIISRLVALKIAAEILDPARDWSWINRAVSMVQARHKPARPKLHRIVDAKELFDFARREMDRLMALETRACDFATFRDHLMIAVLAAFPLRRRNLAGLTLNRTLVRREDTWWVQIPAAETKTKEAIEGPLPSALTPYIDYYLNCYRPLFAGKTDEAILGGAFWASLTGTRMNGHTIYNQVSARTRQGLGRRVNPHLFRDCAATSVAIYDPEHVGIGMRLLGQRAPETMERHYNQARGIEAIRDMQKELLSLRSRSKDPLISGEE